MLYRQGLTEDVLQKKARSNEILTFEMQFLHDYEYNSLYR